jgi:hypothetical protein
MLLHKEGPKYRKVLCCAVFEKIVLLIVYYWSFSSWKLEYMNNFVKITRNAVHIEKIAFYKPDCKDQD